VHLFKFLKFMTSPFLALTPVKTGAQRVILMISHDLIWVKALACIVLGMWSIAMSPTLRRPVIVRPPYHLLVVGRHGDQGAIIEPWTRCPCPAWEAGWDKGESRGCVTGAQPLLEPNTPNGSVYALGSSRIYNCGLG
jgi:hypothetical protein